MAELLYGGAAARALVETLQEKAAALRARGVTPRLAILRAGERPDELAYERAARKRCDALGIDVQTVALDENVARDHLLETVGALNADERVHGILPLRPLPHDAAMCGALAPEKDMDGVTRASMAALYGGFDEGFAPCTAEGCVMLLRHYGVPMSGQRAVVIGRSLVVGRPAAMLLMRENATVTVAHSRTRELPALCRESDILIVAAGREGLIGAEHLREGQTVVDVGIHAHPDGTLRGDVRADEAAQIVRAITPVPGGVGAMTTAVLAAHVIEAASRLG